MTGTRPAVVVLVVGTGTEVGKTWVAARLLDAWRARGVSVAARKPAQSYVPGEGPTDAEVLGEASGEGPAAVCPAERSYPVPMAPPMAAEALGLHVPTVAELAGDVSWPGSAVDVGVVETAGGVRSPQAADGDVVDVARALRPDAVVLVADAGLGTINAVRLSLEALNGPGHAVVVLNRFDPSSELHRRNRDWLRHRDGACVVEATGAGLEALAARLVGHDPAAAG